LKACAEVFQALVEGDARAPPGRLFSFALLLGVHAGRAFVKQSSQLLRSILPSSLYPAWQLRSAEINSDKDSMVLRVWTFQERCNDQQRYGVVLDNFSNSPNETERFAV